MKVIRFRDKFIEYSLENENAIKKYCVDELEFYVHSNALLTKKGWSTKKYDNYTKYTLTYEYTSKINSTQIERNLRSYAILETTEPPIFDGSNRYNPY